MTSTDPRHQKWFIRLGIAGVVFIFAQGYYLYRDDREKSKTTEDLRAAVKNLQDQTGVLMNAIRLQATLDDFRHLEGVISDGFSRLENVIKGQKHSPSSQQRQSQLPPAVVEHVRIVQRRAASSDPNAKYGLQVVMQTDVTMQPVAFRIECDQEITDGKAFIVGEGAYTMYATGFSADHKAFLFSFHTPPFTPDSSLVVALQSKYDIRVTKIEKIQPLI